MRIVVPEPNQLKQDFLPRHLMEEGWQVQISSTGLEAWNLLQDPSLPRVALIESSLAGFTAKELGCRLRSLLDGPHIYLILLANRDNQPTVRAAPAEGWADDLLLEPVDAYELDVRLHASRRYLALTEKLSHTEDTVRRRTGCKRLRAPMTI